jgi:hypothetical protein
VHFLSMAAANSAEVERLALGAGMKKGGAAKGELVLAMYELANCFRNGWGIKKDAAAAKHYYETAANLGDTDAMNEVAWCYIEGFGTKKDKVRSKCVCQPPRPAVHKAQIPDAGWRPAPLRRRLLQALLIACPCHAPACLRHGRGLFSLICWAALWQTAMTAGMMMAMMMMMMMMMMPIPMMVVVVMVLQAVLTRACSSRRLSSCAWQSPRATRHWGTHGKFSFLFFSFPSPSSLVCV